MRSLPLRYRLPNPPAVFVDRTEEMASFHEAVRRSPLLVVAGPEGVGKTALVLQSLHRKKRVDRTMYVDVRRGGVDELRLELLEAVAETEGVQASDVGAFRGDPDTAIAELLDLAERGPWWFVLDNLHHVDVDDARALLEKLARYARKSRWIAITRRNPEVTDDAARLLSISGMQCGDLERLASLWGVEDPGRVERAAAVSGGSPWLLRQCLLHGRDEAEVTREGLLDGMPPDQVELADALSVVDVPLPPDALATFCPPCLDAGLATLEARGLLKRMPAGIRLHEVARSVLAAAAGSGRRAQWRARAAEGLAASEDPLVALEGLRLLMSIGRLGDVVASLDRHGPRYLEAGHAPALWRLLCRTTDPRFEGWRLRCATELGNPTALRMILEPSQKNVADRVAWAQTLFMQGRLDEAERTAKGVLVLMTPESDPSLVFEAAFVLANCATARGDLGAAADRLARLTPPSAPDAARRDSALASGLAGTPRAPEAHAIANTVAKSIDALPTPAREEVAYRIAQVRRLEGRLGDAATLLRTATVTPRGAEVQHVAARRALWLGAAVALERGRLAEAEEGLAKLAPFVRTASIFRPDIVCTSVGLRIARGDFHGLPGLIADARREASDIDLAEATFVARALETQLASLHALALALAPAPAPAPGERTAGADLLFVRTLDRGVLSGQPPTDEDLARLATVGSSSLGPLAAVVRARAALLGAGDAVKALSEVRAAVGDAAASEHRVVEAEARLAYCDVLACLGRAEEFRPAAGELASLARALASPRFEAESRFVAATSADRPEWAVLEHLAARPEVAPVAARRSRVLLGEQTPLDAWDRLLLERLGARLGPERPRLVREDAPSRSREAGEGREGAAWGIDEPTRRVWLPNARWVEFGRRALHWELLVALAAAGGVASKEALVVAVWDEAEYHPLKHDARLQVAVRKLRELIEEEPSAPARLVTTEEGYALAGVVRRVRASAAG